MIRRGWIFQQRGERAWTGSIGGGRSAVGGRVRPFIDGFVYADTSMVLATIKSDPAGFVTESSNYMESNSTQPPAV